MERRKFLKRVSALLGISVIPALAPRRLPKPEPKMMQSFFSVRLNFEFDKLEPIAERDYRIPIRFNSHGGL